MGYNARECTFGGPLLPSSYSLKVLVLEKVVMRAAGEVIIQTGFESQGRAEGS
jgi:hypothetical protein